MSRIVVWFSCGAASACAAKLAVEQYFPGYVHVVYCNTLISEHPDNIRFMQDVSQWIGKHIKIISSKKYTSIDEVFERERYMSGIAGARCTIEMKKVPRFDFQLPDDTHIFGLTADEGKRIERFERNNPELKMDWILRDEGIMKDDCYKMLREAGINLPVMYSLGFKNNNCIGCVKASSPVYWDRVRQHFPDVFTKRAHQSRAIGCRLVRYQGKRMFLDELPVKNDDVTPEQDIECGVVCMTEQGTEESGVTGKTL